MNNQSKTAILLMAHGSPASLDEIPAYLTSLRGGRPADEKTAAELRQRYAAIGGSSPMLTITRAQAAALEAELNRRTDGGGAYRVYVGTRYWKPSLEDGLAQIATAGHDAVLAICMVPHPSRLTIRAYAEKIERARENLPRPLDIRMMPPWENQPRYLDALEDILRRSLTRVQKPWRVLFTAHSLPKSALRPDEDYVQRLERTAALLADRLDFEPESWQVCFQCAPVQDGTWLSPYLDARIAAAAGQVNSIVAVPIGFVSDHLEVLFDLDVEARSQAQSLGLNFVRTPSLNTHRLLIKALAKAVLAGEFQPKENTQP